MRRAILAILAMMLLGGGSGCCCMNRMFCQPWGGCHGGCGCDEGYSDGGCESCGGGPGPEYASGGHGGCATCGGAAGLAHDPRPSRPIAKHVRKPRHVEGEYEFAAGPPTGGVTYPYYTNRGPRDFLARNPQSIGP